MFTVFVARIRYQCTEYRSR